jgi:hypothetical protein
MVFVLVSAALAIGLFLGMLLFLEIGRRLAVRRVVKRGASASVGVGVVDGAVYGLLALLIGFMFHGAADRFDRRRQLIADQENAAGTAWLRVDALPTEQQGAVRAGLRRYMDALIAYYALHSSAQVPLQESPELRRAESDLWATAVSACKAPGGDPARMLLLPTLNELFDAVDMERMSRRIHPPFIIFVMLAIAALATALFAGHGMASAPRNWMYIVGTAATVSIATYVIIELEFPRVGLFRVTAMDQVLVELRASMK